MQVGEKEGDERWKKGFHCIESMFVCLLICVSSPDNYLPGNNQQPACLNT